MNEKSARWSAAIRDKAVRVVAQHRARAEAHDAVERESYELMTAVLAWLRPAFPALATQGEVTLWPGLAWRQRGDTDELLIDGVPALKGLPAMAAWLAHGDVDRTLDRFCELLDQQLTGASDKRTAQALERAERLRAVRTLLSIK